MSEPNTNNFSKNTHHLQAFNGVDRRDFFRMAGLGTFALLMPKLSAVAAGPFDPSDFQKLVPADKKLHPDWVKSLYDRGTATVFRGAELDTIGMPIGGVCTGQLYLGGDGKIWHWDIFNDNNRRTGDRHYAHPPKPDSALDQGFAVQITRDGKQETRSLDRKGFSDVSFCGQYPIGTVEYKDAAAPVQVKLEAFSPFIPLATDDSSLPATIFQFTVTNTSKESVNVLLTGWLQNAVCRSWKTGLQRNRIIKARDLTLLHCTAEEPLAQGSTAPDVVFEDWNKESYEGWTVEGTAFGKRPVKRSEVPGYQGDLGGEGERVVNTHASAPANDVVARDTHVGKLTSSPFKIQRNFINFWIGGGSFKDKTCLNLVIDGRVVESATGATSNQMSLECFDVRKYLGKNGVIEIVDAERGGWGQIGVGKITFSDRPPQVKPDDTPDFGSMGLALLGKKPDHAVASVENGGMPSEEASANGGPLVGALGRKIHLRPGKSATIDFVLTWYFPNLTLGGMGKVGRHYAPRFHCAQAVAQYVAENFGRLTSQTRLWRDTWTDSTLPHWFLERTFLTNSVLASSTSYWFANKRFYGWEGVGCCPGTCSHVWQYAHGPARIFPELERSAREVGDYGAGWMPDGRLRFRGEHNDHWAVDGQAGTILRVYREHQMSADDQFLRRLWPKVKKSIEFLISRDPGKCGILSGNQHNTLDADWFGKVAWLSSMYLACLRAGEAMAREMGDEEFARETRKIADEGLKNIDSELFNGEYYIQKPDEQHLKTVGSYDGCEIHQVFGQSWAWQVGLDRVLPEAHVKQALSAMWKYNFTPDVGPYRDAYKKGRWYAMAGEGGLIMCTWPKGEDMRSSKDFDFYFNECWTGSEYMVAGHMIWEGMLMEGLAITRMVHDRHHARLRNPWNEVECGDHYARSMASYGVYTAVCGFEYHGPRKHIGFAPRLAPENFRAAFTGAEGWGVYSQKISDSSTNAEIALKWGKLSLKTIALASASPKHVQVVLNRKTISATVEQQGNRVMIELAREVQLGAGDTLKVKVG